eukprot:4902218-Pleurochrysis_carterae.AAC.1
MDVHSEELLWFVLEGELESRAEELEVAICHRATGVRVYQQSSTYSTRSAREPSPYFLKK